MTNTFPDFNTLQQLEQQENFQEVVRLLEPTALEELPKQHQAMYAFALLQRDRKKEAEKLFFKLLESNQIDARVYLGLSILSGNRQQKTERLMYAEQGLKCMPDQILQSRLICSKARALADLGNGEEAIHLLEETLRSLPTNAIRVKARCYYNLQSIYALLDNFKKQEKYAKKALQLCGSLEMHTLEISVMADLGYRLYYKNRPDEAFELTTQAIEIATKIESLQLSEIIIQNIELNLLERNYSKVEKDIQKLEKLQKSRDYCRLQLIKHFYETECLWRQRKITQFDFEKKLLDLEPINSFEEVIVHFCQGFISFLQEDRKSAQYSFKACVQGNIHWLDSFRVRAQAFLAALEWQEQGVLGNETSHLLDLLNKVGGELALYADVLALKDYYQHCQDQSSQNPSIRNLAQIFSRTYPTLNITTGHEITIQLNSHPIIPSLSAAEELLVYLSIHGPSSQNSITTHIFSKKGNAKNYFRRALASIREVCREYLPSNNEIIQKEGELYQIWNNIDLRLDLNTIKEASFSNDPKKLREAKDLFNSSLLITIKNNWTQDILLKTEKYYSDILKKLALFSFENGQYDEAYQMYHEATHYDLLDQDAWKGAIYSKIRIKDLEGARKTARECREKIFAEYNEEVNWPFLEINENILDD